MRKLLIAFMALFLFSTIPITSYGTYDAQETKTGFCVDVDVDNDIYIYASVEDVYFHSENTSSNMPDIVKFSTVEKGNCIYKNDNITIKPYQLRSPLYGTTIRCENYKYGLAKCEIFKNKKKIKLRGRYRQVKTSTSDFSYLR